MDSIKELLTFTQFIYENELKDIVNQRKQSLLLTHAYISGYLCLPREIVPKVKLFVETVIPDMSSQDFKHHFRIERMTYLFILEKLQPYLITDHVGGKAQASPQKQLLLFLWYISNQDSMKELSVLFNLAISTVHATLLKLAKLVYRVLNKAIQWPDGNRQAEIERTFQLQFGLPNIVGIIDGTHIQLSHIPGGDQDYVNRKGYASVQLQLVVDHDLLITSAQTGWPGCAHDARVLRNSGLYDRAEYGNLINPNRHIIGDSAYLLRTC